MASSFCELLKLDNAHCTMKYQIKQQVQIREQWAKIFRINKRAGLIKRAEGKFLENELTSRAK